MPSPVEALPWGSRSMISTCSPIAASAVPRLIAVVVLPTPPFWLAIAITRGGCGLGMRLASGTTSGTSAGRSTGSVMASRPARGSLERDDFSSGHHPALDFCFARDLSENRFPLFGFTRLACESVAILWRRRITLQPDNDDAPGRIGAAGRKRRMHVPRFHLRRGVLELKLCMLSLCEQARCAAFPQERKALREQ